MPIKKHLAFWSILNRTSSLVYINTPLRFIAQTSKCRTYENKIEEKCDTAKQFNGTKYGKVSSGNNRIITKRKMPLSIGDGGGWQSVVGYCCCCCLRIALRPAYHLLNTIMTICIANQIMGIEHLYLRTIRY